MFTTILDTGEPADSPGANPLVAELPEVSEAQVLAGGEGAVEEQVFTTILDTGEPADSPGANPLVAELPEVSEAQVLAGGEGAVEEQVFTTILDTGEPADSPGANPLVAELPEVSEAQVLAGGEGAVEEQVFTTILDTGEPADSPGANPLVAELPEVSEAHECNDFVDEADEPTEGSQSPGIVEAIRDEAADGVSEYIANGLETAVLQRVFACWQAPDLAELARAAEAVGGLESELHTILIGEPGRKNAC